MGVGTVSKDEIDTHGFSWARRQVFARALDALPASSVYDRIIVDGTGFFDGYGEKSFLLEAKADQKYECVAAASIVAKVSRDNGISRLCDAEPALAATYGWSTNMGYPTALHRTALQEKGPCSFHRMTFAPCRASVVRAPRPHSPPPSDEAWESR